MDVTTLADWIDACQRGPSRPNKDHLTHSTRPSAMPTTASTWSAGFTRGRGSGRREAARDPGEPAPPLVGSTLISKVGGASGPLYGTAFRRAGKALGTDRTSTRALGQALQAALEGVQRPRGRGRGRQDDGRRARARGPRVPHALATGGDCFLAAAQAAADGGGEGAEATIPLQALKGRAAIWEPAASGTRTRAPRPPHCCSPHSLRRWPGRGRDHGVRGSGLLPGGGGRPRLAPPERSGDAEPAVTATGAEVRAAFEAAAVRLDDLAGSLRRDGATSSADILDTEAQIARDPAFVEEAVGLLSGPDAVPAGRRRHPGRRTPRLGHGRTCLGRPPGAGGRHPPGRPDGRRRARRPGPAHATGRAVRPARARGHGSRIS